jgi:intracellular sulfur oxidation DsrE/DsrF family protein
MSFSLLNFWAEVELTPHGSGIEFIPSQEHDLLSFSNMKEFSVKISACGFYGGVRLLQVRRT